LHFSQDQESPFYPHFEVQFKQKPCHLYLFEIQYALGTMKKKLPKGDNMLHKILCTTKRESVKGDVGGALGSLG